MRILELNFLAKYKNCQGCTRTLTFVKPLIGFDLVVEDFFLYKKYIVFVVVITGISNTMRMDVNTIVLAFILVSPNCLYNYIH